jgi:hypothetical protein
MSQVSDVAHMYFLLFQIIQLNVEKTTGRVGFTSAIEIIVWNMHVMASDSPKKKTPEEKMWLLLRHLPVHPKWWEIPSDSNEVQRIVTYSKIIGWNQTHATYLLVSL